MTGQMKMQTYSNRQNAAPSSTPTQYLSDTQVAIRYGVSRQTVWRWAATDETFPNSIKLSPGCTRWRLSDIEAWESQKGAA
jgi:predicted DNA-binding transcriptional regulator AlpA